MILKRCKYSFRWQWPVRSCDIHTTCFRSRRVPYSLGPVVVSGCRLMFHRRFAFLLPNHYSKWKRLVVSKFLCGKLWVRFPTKIKTTKHITHKNWTTTKDIYGIPDGKSLL